MLKPGVSSSRQLLACVQSELKACTRISGSSSGESISKSSGRSGGGREDDDLFVALNRLIPACIELQRVSKSVDSSFSAFSTQQCAEILQVQVIVIAVLAPYPHANIHSMQLLT